MNFIAIDFETANSSKSSVCALGIAVVESGRIIERNSWLIHPKTLEFNIFNSRVHGITEHHVKDKPKFNELWETIKNYIDGKMIISHNTSFDINVLLGVLDAYNIEYPTIEYACSLEITKKVWPDLSSYKLSNLAELIGISMQHHDAEDDAYAASCLILKFAEFLGVQSIHKFLELIDFRPGQLSPSDHIPFRPIYRRKPKVLPSIQLKETAAALAESTVCDSEHLLFDQQVVFTGTLKSFPRPEAIKRVLAVGGKTADSVTRKTDILVVGLEENKSGKLKKAEQMIEKSHHIKILTEDEFIRLL